MEPGNDGTAAVEEAGGNKPTPGAGEPQAVGNSNSNLPFRRELDDRPRVSPTETLDASDPQVRFCGCGVCVVSHPGTAVSIGWRDLKAIVRWNNTLSPLSVKGKKSHRICSSTGRRVPPPPFSPQCYVKSQVS